MSIETDIQSALSATFGGRVFPDTAPPTTQRPFCIYQQVGGVSTPTFCGEPVTANGRFQFWVWANSREQSSTLMRTAAAILTATPLRGVSQGGLVAQYDEPTKTYGALQIFSFWA